MSKEMTLDDALLRIVELEETIENQNNVICTLNSEKETNSKEIEKLQKSNMELFLKVTSKPKEENNTEIKENNESKMDKLLKEWE
ncbi:hypothetical protein CPS1_10 [Clostridium phage CPS1]|uniref:Uncharacterized protein n=1 Tax=Clostridium phage CPS1 TaxID=1983541 RepID=A0A2D0WYE7_9CAUD|nr:hypothetical protein H3026_gp10 [Clostridium phage CPS1]ARW58300.1 hypothetical protein CPS1_10 [Clostridium phage CPS1]